jgi:hypothetical protein
MLKKRLLRDYLFNLAIVLVSGFYLLTSFNLRFNRSTIQNTPYPPTKMAIRALSLGDEQFLFRYYALALQNAGDKIGYVSSIKSHNYKRLFYGSPPLRILILSQE